MHSVPLKDEMLHSINETPKDEILGPINETPNEKILYTENETSKDEISENNTLLPENTSRTITRETTTSNILHNINHDIIFFILTLYKYNRYYIFIWLKV